MEFSKRIFHRLFWATGTCGRQLRWIAVCALLASVSLAHFNSRPARAAQTAALSPPLDVAQAAHPLTTDPLLMQQKLTANDGGANDAFGFSVALSGDTLVVGAEGDDIGSIVDQGSAYVFTRSGGVWTLQQRLTAEDGAAGDLFGISVGISGDTVVVGAAGGTIGSNVAQGSVYVFIRINGVWRQQQKLTADDGGTNDIFGRSVAISGDSVVVGASGNNGTQGSAYVFTRSETVWTQQEKLLANDGAAGDRFGFPVVITGDTVVVGAPFDIIGANADQGSAYVFTRNGTVWTQQQKLTANDGSAEDIFGFSIAISADTIVVGALSDLTGANGSQGSAYVFTRSFANGQAVWTQQQKLVPDDSVISHHFGFSVAISGDTVVVGANNDEIGGNRDQGSAYVFTRSFASNGAAWAQQQRLIANDGAAGDVFGASLAFSGDTLVVGASLDGIDTNRAQGSAYVFVSPARPSVAIVSAASFLGTSLATESIVAAFGGGLATSTEVATTQPLPETLGGTRISVLDSQGTERFAPLFFVSPTQINFQISPGTAAGKALVTIIQDGESVAATSPQIRMIAPSLFSANANGRGLVIGVGLRLKADGSQSFEPIARFDQDQQQFVAVPINLDSTTDNVFLILFGTGLRNRSSLDSVQVKIGGLSLDALYAGPQGSFVGLDQLNVLLPRTLAGRGEVDLNVLVDGQEANKLELSIK